MTYPTISPKLTLDFANSRKLDPRIAFSRSSSATYIHPDTGLITTAPDDVARFVYGGVIQHMPNQRGHRTLAVGTGDSNHRGPDLLKKQVNITQQVYTGIACTLHNTGAHTYAGAEQGIGHGQIRPAGAIPSDWQIAELI